MPSTTEGALSPMTDRQRRIVELVRAQGFATIERLAGEFRVSSQTVRRDIIYLDSIKLLQRFHGGAGLADTTVRLGYLGKSAVFTAGKARIGEAAAAIIPDSAAVFLDVGTTVEAVARALKGHHELRIFTNSLHSAAVFDARDTEVYVTGGMLRGGDGSLVDGEVSEAISRFRFDFAVLGCSGFEADGSVMDFDLKKVAVKRAAMANSRQVVLVADQSKFERSAIVRIGRAGDVSTLVTDRPLPPALAQLFESAGTRIVVCE